MAKDIMPPALTEDSCNKTYIRIIKKKRKPNFLRNNLKTYNLGIVSYLQRSSITCALGFII